MILKYLINHYGELQTVVIEFAVLVVTQLPDKQPIILIARITPIILKNPEEGMKLVNQLYLAATKNNNYSVFRLGEERIIVVPNSVQVEEDFAFHQNQNALIYDDEDAQANNNNNNEK